MIVIGVDPHEYSLAAVAVKAGTTDYVDSSV
jgi:hypothetical protein